MVSIIGMVGGLALAVIIWIYAIYDAYNTAKRINMSG
jgi:hypothetical protein